MFFKKAHVQSGWNDWARNSETPLISVGRSDNDFGLKVVVDDVIEKLGINETHSVLDVGCGAGSFLSLIAKQTTQLTGVDFSDEMLKKAKELLPDATFYLASVEKLPFSDGQFDRVVCYSVLHYLSSAGQGKSALKELVRICKPGGYVFIGDLPSKLHYKRLFPWRKRFIMRLILLIKRKNRGAYHRSFFIHKPSTWLFFDLIETMLFLKELCSTVTLSNQVENNQWGSESAKYRFDIIIKR